MPVASAAPSRPAFPPRPPLPLVSTAASLARISATVTVLAAAESSLLMHVPLPPRVPPAVLSGRSALSRFWEKGPYPMPPGFSRVRCLFSSACRASPPRPPPSAAHVYVQDDVFRDGCASPATLRGYLRALSDLALWSGSLHTHISNLRELDVAAFLRGQSSRGTSVPPRLYRAIVWMEKGFWVCPPLQLPTCEVPGHPSFGRT